MKNVLFSLFAFSGITTYAQTSFTTHDSIDANNINARIMVHGDMWWDPATGKQKCEFPKGSGRHVGFAGTLWLSGYDQSNKLHVAAQTYRQDGNDYWPGPLDDGGSLDYATSTQWAKIWKVTREEINQYKVTTYHTTANTPSSILTWPAKGNAYARGKDSSVLVIDREMAPFVDLNGDGKYQPLKGDYPAIKGEQTLWWVFSDNGPTHAQTEGDPLKVEVQAMAYAYKRGTLIDNVVYYDYTLVNRSANDYHDFRFALWDDVDLAYYMNNYIGFDSTWRMGICYNAINSDGGAAGSPSNSYGKSPSMVGLTFVSLPEDNESEFKPAGSFMIYNNDFSRLGTPKVDTEYNNYMRSTWRDGAPLTYTYEGRGVPNYGYGGSVPCRYIFDGDPSDSTKWSECQSDNNIGDRRFIISSNNFLLAAGSKKKVVLAKVADTSLGGCPGTNFKRIKEVADTAWHNYYNPQVSVPTTTGPHLGIKVYPNPAHNTLHINNETAGNMQLTVCNMLGQVMGVYESKRGDVKVVDVVGYAPGVYVVRCSSEDGVSTMKFVKE